MTSKRRFVQGGTWGKGGGGQHWLADQSVIYFLNDPQDSYKVRFKFKLFMIVKYKPYHALHLECCFTVITVLPQDVWLRGHFFSGSWAPHM